MAKYYVQSGDLRTVIDRPTPLEALVDAMRSQVGNCEKLGTWLMMSEAGFDHFDDDATMVYPTAKVLELAGVTNQFRCSA